MIIPWKNFEHSWRKQLLSYAHGNVLEISIGTGENFKYYPLHVKVTATDISARVIKKAKAEAEAYRVNAEFIKSPAEDLDFSADSFDTIVSTFSISEYENPVSVLKQFNTWCKPEGSVLLMEHGLSQYAPVRAFQKILDTRYYKKTGSHISRDIMAMIQHSDLAVKKLERKIAGMIYMVWASPVIEQEKN